MEERRVAAWIGASIVIKGDLISSENLTIAGQVEGDVTVREHSLIVASDGAVRGNVVAGTVVVEGKVTGNITSVGRVEVGEAGTVEGEISAPRMAVSEGATLSGRLRVSKSGS